jgi:SAM-dependent methyltransferase
MSQATARRRRRVTRPSIAVQAGWPLARRLGVGAVRFGGPAMTERLVAGAHLAAGDRVVDLLPGNADLARRVLPVGLHAWTGVCTTPEGADRLRRAVGHGPGRDVVVGSPDATALPDGSATVVLAEGLLTGLADAGKLAVLREARRVLRPGGRLAVHELAVLQGDWASEPPEAVRARMAPTAQGGLRPLSEGGWRALVEAAGLEMVGTSAGHVVVPGARDILRQEGPRRTAAIAARVLRPGRAGTRWRRAADHLRREDARLEALVVVARRPVVGALRPRG